MNAWHGWQRGYVGEAWLSGELDSAQLDEHLSDPEALRALRDAYTEDLMERYDDRAGELRRERLKLEAHYVERLRSCLKRRHSAGGFDTEQRWWLHNLALRMIGILRSVRRALQEHGS